MTRRIDQPEPGFYQTRLCNGGWKVGVRIWRDETTDELHIEVNGRTHNAAGERLDVDETWPFLESIDAAEFRYLRHTREWAEQYAPHHPAADPFQSIDLSKLPPRF